MMNDILKQINVGEVSRVQFKEHTLGKYGIACELVAFSNSHGGKLIVDIKDKAGETNTLSYSEVQETTNLLSNIASEDVAPSILIKIDTVEAEDGNLVITTVKEELDEPYHDNKGTIWVENSADKRKVFDNTELTETMTGYGSFAPSEAGVRDATINDLDVMTIKQYLGSRFERVLEEKGLTSDAFNEASLDMICSTIAKRHDCEKMLHNLRFIRPDGSLTAAAMPLFSKYTQRWLPMITAKCICFAGNSVGSKVFRDKVNDADMEGNLLHQYDAIMDFFTRNLHNVQVEDEFSNMGKLEILYTSSAGFAVNSLVHHSLNIKAPVRIFIFNNRMEIHSPDALPDGFAIGDIKAGASMPRNMFLFNNTIYLLPYTDVGSGIIRTLSKDTSVTFMSSDKAREFVITIWRGESNQVEKKSNQVEERSNQVEQKSNEVEGRSNQVQDSGTKEMSLSNKQRDIVSFCSVPRATAEIMERLGLSNQTKNRERYTTSLVAAGYLQMTSPDSPTASSRKYKKVNKG